MKSQNNSLFKIKAWLLAVFSDLNSIDELYLFGSVLNPSAQFRDVDIIQKITILNKEEILTHAGAIANIKQKFFSEFHIPLHITSFTTRELKEFHAFINKNHIYQIR